MSNRPRQMPSQTCWAPKKNLNCKFYKCLAVAEMGERFATINTGRGLRMCNKNTMVSYTQLTTAQKPQHLQNKLRHSPKSWRLLCPFREGGAVSPSDTMWPGPRPVSVPSGILIHPTVWPQHTNVKDDRTDRQDNGPIA